MRKPTRAVVAILMAGAALFVTGCGLIGPMHRATDSTAIDETISSVRFDSGSGSITIEGDADPGEGRLERTVTTRDDRTVGPTHYLDGDVLVLEGCGRWCSVDYVVRLPEGVDVSGRTSNGAIELSDVGEVDVRTTNGRISLDGVAGSVAAESSNGRIEGEGLDGSGIEVSTSNGSIDLELGSAQDVSAGTSNGAIEVRVPDGSYRIDAETSNGRTDLQVPNDEGGTYVLDLRTSNGAITVRPANED